MLYQILLHKGSNELHEDGDDTASLTASLTAPAPAPDPENIDHKPPQKAALRLQIRREDGERHDGGGWSGGGGGGGWGCRHVDRRLEYLFLKRVLQSDLIIILLWC